MANKKIVFVIVEGPSDDEALSVLLDKLYDPSKVFVHITHCDITTATGNNSNNIRNKVGNIINQYKKSNHLKVTDFQEIVHILDMDGAFIPDEAVIEDSTAEHPIYSTAEIRTANVEGIKKRNEVKRGCLIKLSSTLVLAGIPYQAYYMSSNLDHVLYDALNSTDEEKERNAYLFAKKYRNDLQGFIKFISESDFSIGGDYVESWKYIRKDKHSLERHTNLGICIERAVNHVDVKEE